MQRRYEEKAEYLRFREAIHNVAASRLHLSLLEAFRQEHTDMAQGAATALTKAGNEIREAEYNTEHSQWM